MFVSNHIFNCAISSFSPPSCHGPHSPQSNIHVTFREDANFFIIIVSFKMKHYCHSTVWHIFGTVHYEVNKTLHRAYSLRATRRVHVGQDFLCSFVYFKVSRSCPCFTALEEGGLDKNLGYHATTVVASEVCDATDVGRLISHLSLRWKFYPIQCFLRQIEIQAKLREILVELWNKVRFGLIETLKGKKERILCLRRETFETSVKGMLILQPRQDRWCGRSWTCDNGECKMLPSVVNPLRTDTAHPIQSTALTTTYPTVCLSRCASALAGTVDLDEAKKAPSENSFRVKWYIIAHKSLSAIKFSKDTVHHNIKVSSIYDTGSGQHQFANERQWGGALQAVISRASYRRVPRNGESSSTMLSLHTNYQFVRKRGIGKKLLRAVLLKWYKIMSTWWRAISTALYGATNLAVILDPLTH